MTLLGMENRNVSSSAARARTSSSLTLTPSSVLMTVRFGAAFLMDSGSSCGEISGHAKSITSLAVRHQRPFRAISGSDDSSVVLHTAVPFKYDKMISTHSRFVRDVAYSPNGEMFASVGSDGKLFVYEGKAGEVKGEADRGGATSTLVSPVKTSERTAEHCCCRWRAPGVLIRPRSRRPVRTASCQSVS